MYQIFYTVQEALFASVILFPILLILNHTRFHSTKTTALYLLFTIYLSGIYAVVGLPNVSYVRFDLNVNFIPFVGMLSGLSGTILNIIMFIPLGVFLPILWKRCHSLRYTTLLGFGLSLAIELLQIFTLRATDINDLITNTTGTFIGYWIGILAVRLFPALHCRSSASDLPVLFVCTAATMFFFQPLIWNLIY